MEGGAGSGARPEQRQEEDGAQSATASSDGSAPPRRRSRKEFTREQWSAAMAFIDAVIADYKVYADMTEDEVREEYRRAGKLHRYLPDIELYKSYARVAKKMPPPDGFLPEKDKYLKLIEDEE